AKSETCSGLGLTEGVVGNEGADIVCSSNDDNQASILYDAIDTMRLMIDPYQQDTHKNQRYIKIKATNSKIFKLSDRTRNKEGRNIDFAIIDEVHEMKDNVILKSIEQSQSLKDNPKLIIITTEGFVNDGALDSILRDCRKIISGEDDSISAERTLPWLYTQDSEQEIWTDEASWQKSNPSLGTIKKYSYLRTQIDSAKKNKADRIFVLSKDFNFKQNGVQAWLNTEDYKYSAVYDIEYFRSAICLGAVDLSETTDMTSAKILLMKPNDKVKYIFQHYWIPESKLENADDKQAGAKYTEWAKSGLLTICEGNDIDLTVVADWFYRLYKDYHIRLYKCGYDVKFSKEFLKRMDDYGFDTEIVLQNKLTLSNAMKLCEADLKARLVNYNQNEIDMWCLGNSAMELDSRGNCQAVKIAGQPSKRIDGAVTLIILYEMFRRYRSEFLKALR
ncbi:MAG: terminase large subunit, partial [Oscillospiraceae bacterium]|nr:terminase large subunit [Oscillospiraceae bacterium]